MTLADPADTAAPTPERLLRSPVEPLQAPIADTRGDYGTPHRAIDALERLHRSGHITGAMLAAGNKFAALFRRAALDPLRAADMMREPGGGKSTEWSNSAEAARVKLSALMRLLGGHSSYAGMVAWDVLGWERSLWEWATEHGLDVREARGMLRVTLDTLASRERGPR